MVLDAAMRIYLRDGIGAINMEAVAAEAQVTKPVVYACYPNRDAVLDALMDRQAENVARHLAAALAAATAVARSSGTIYGALRAGFEAFLRSVQAEPDAYRASVLWEHGATADLMRRVRATNVEQVAAISAEIQRWLAQRGTPTTPEAAHLVAHTLVHLGRTYILLILRDDPAPPIETLAALAARATLAIGDELGIETD